MICERTHTQLPLADLAESQNPNSNNQPLEKTESSEAVRRKSCSKCGLLLPIDLFAIRTDTGRRRKECSPCKRLSHEGKRRLDGYKPRDQSEADRQIGSATDTEVIKAIQNRRADATPFLLINCTPDLRITNASIIHIVLLLARMMQWKRIKRQVRILKRPEVIQKLKARNHLPEVASKRKNSAKQRYHSDPEYRANLLKNSSDYYKANKPRRYALSKVWIANNSEKYRKWMADHMRNKRQTDPWYCVRNRLASRLWHALTSQGAGKAFKTEALIGCTVAELRDQLQRQFTEGMTWDKFLAGEISIDHLTPCAAFDLTKPEEQKKCFHHSNLAPKWTSDNQRKGDLMPDGTRGRHLRRKSPLQSMAA